MRYVPITRSIYLAPALSRRCTRPRRRLPRVPPSAGSSASGGSASGVSQITSNWDTFFDSATPDSKRVQLLQNGSQFASSIKAYASGALAAAVTSKGDSVTLSSATQAKVEYDLSAMGTTPATHMAGTAVLHDGTWRVGDDVFCSLLTQAKSAGLSVPMPSACSSAS
ncbi:MAG: hypothetical protein QOG28_5095 [Trebonia sp.]|nr:hypothetical protein [Trebonia sp.]